MGCITGCTEAAHLVESERELLLYLGDSIIISKQGERECSKEGEREIPAVLAMSRGDTSPSFWEKISDEEQPTTSGCEIA